MSDSFEPQMTKLAPYTVELEPNKEYYYCTCGLSKKQPFCDGSHRRENTGMKPTKVTVDEKKTVYFCGCRKTNNSPFCDGTHKSIRAERESSLLWYSAAAFVGAMALLFWKADGACCHSVAAGAAKAATGAAKIAGKR